MTAVITTSSSSLYFYRFGEQLGAVTSSSSSHGRLISEAMEKYSVGSNQDGRARKFKVLPVSSAVSQVILYLKD